MIIRQFKETDISKIHSLFNKELGYDIPYADLSERIRQMQKAGNYFILCAEEKNEVIGFIGLQICLAFEICDNVMRIIAFAVSKEFQHQGIGTKLIQEAEKFAMEHHVASILINSGVKRIDTHKFYISKGYYKKGYSFCKSLKLK